MPTADKRQRKKENARMAREARLAAEKRRRRLRGARNAAVVAGVFILGIVLINVFTGSDKKNASSSTTVATTPTTEPKVKVTGFVADPKKKYTATIGTNFGTIVVALDAKTAPKAAGRFVELARKGYYNGLPWTRAAKDFVIQAGDSSGNPDIIGEVPTDHYPVGSVAAAKSPSAPAGTMDAAFFITTGPNGATLPNDYASFGTVTSGITNAQKIAALYPPDSGDGPPTKPATITKITITES